MTIRQGILLLGAIAALCLAYLLADGFIRRMSEYRAQKIMAEELRLTPALWAIVHELQRERGLSSGYLGRTTRRQMELMLAQRSRTDEALASHPLSDAEVLRLLANLQDMRRQILDGDVPWSASHAFYTGEVERILSRLTELARTSSVIANDVQALVYLVTAKEYLGQIRALVNRALSDWGVLDQETSYAVARNEARVRTRLELFRRNAPEALAAAYDQAMSADGVQESLELVSKIGSSQFREAVVFPDTWFDTVSLAIDAIRRVEIEVLAVITEKLDNMMQSVRFRLVRDIVVTLSLGFLVFFLVAYTTRRLLHILGTLTESINEVTTTRDFSTRLHTRSKGEIAVIVRGFNELLDVAERLLKEKHRLAYTDGLTGIANRLHFTEVAHNQLARKERHPGPLSLIMFDIDHFKRINDTFGHDVGDDVLRELSGRIRAAIRSIDVFARWGGEEFVILLPDDPPEAAVMLAEKLRGLVEKKEFAGAGRVTASFGVAGLRRGEEYDSLCKRADQALYESKHQGRNRVTVAS